MRAQLSALLPLSLLAAESAPLFPSYAQDGRGSAQLGPTQLTGLLAISGELLVSGFLKS
jgi:hypothetical protein